MSSQDEHTVADTVKTVYLILQSIKTFEDEFKHGVEVVRARRGYKDIGVAVKMISKAFR